MSRFECHIDRIGQHTIKITGNDGSQPKESTRNLNELTKASKDNANDAMFASIKTYDGKNRQVFEDWINKID